MFGQLYPAVGTHLVSAAEVMPVRLAFGDGHHQHIPYQDAEDNPQAGRVESAAAAVKGFEDYVHRFYRKHERNDVDQVGQEGVADPVS